MTAASALKAAAMCMADGCLTSLPTFFTIKCSHPFLSLPPKPIRLLHLSCSSSSLFSIRKRVSFVSLVAHTSDWAQREKQGDVEGAEAGVSEWEGEDGTEERGVGGQGELEEGDEGSYSEPPEEAKLFVGNLPFDMDSEKLAHLFGKAGIVEVAEVIYNRDTDQSRGFGFVTMSTIEEAEKAVDILNNYDCVGRLLTVNKAAPRGSRQEISPRKFQSSFRIYVGNLPWTVDEARLEQVFSKHGEVVDAKVVYDRETERSRGFGFVTMSTQTELDDAVAALDGQSLDGRALRVNVAEERPRRGSF